MKVMAFGTFDILHPGHLAFLEEAKKLGDSLAVVIARDETVLKVKGKLPRNSEKARRKNLSALLPTVEVLLGHLDDHYRVIRESHPDVIALGYDQNSFTDKLANIDGAIKIVRLRALNPDFYKSSKL